MSALGLYLPKIHIAIHPYSCMIRAWQRRPLLWSWMLMKNWPPPNAGGNRSHPSSGDASSRALPETELPFSPSCGSGDGFLVMTI